MMEGPIYGGILVTAMPAETNEAYLLELEIEIRSSVNINSNGREYMGYYVNAFKKLRVGLFLKSWQVVIFSE